MRGRGITNLIDCLHCRINCSIKTNRVFRTRNIQIDRARKTNGVNSISRQCLCTAIGTVTTNDNQSVNAMLSTDVSALGLTFLCRELLTTSCSENRTTALDDIGNGALFHIYDLFI